MLHLSMRKWMAPWHMLKEGMCVCVCVAVLVYKSRPNTTLGTIWAGIGHLLLGCATHGPMQTHSVTAAM